MVRADLDSRDDAYRWLAPPTHQSVNASALRNALCGCFSSCRAHIPTKYASYSELLRFAVVAWTHGERYGQYGTFHMPVYLPVGRFSGRDNL